MKTLAKNYDLPFLMHSLAEADFESGEIILVDKPEGWTSSDVVRKLRNLFRAKTGHGGTLDPLATGLLLLATGRATKKLNELQNLSKEYTGSFYLGATTPSFDRETETDQVFENNDFDLKHLQEEAASFIGDIEQMPPVYSAIKVGGKPAYKSAHKGQHVELQPRTVSIYDFRIEAVRPPLVDFYVHCSKGTYIRSLANDFGKIMGSGAYLHSLCRTSIGEYKLEDAWQLERLVEELKALKVSKENETP